MKGRRPAQQPALLWDYRRGKVLVDALSMPMDSDDQQRARMGALDQLADAWGVEGYIGMTNDEITQALARHCQQHYRDEKE